MDTKIARPEIFMRELHPETGRGRIFLERAVGNSRHRSLVSPSEAEKIIRPSYGVPDLHISVASFLGMPLVINFEKTRCLYIRVKQSTDAVRRLFNILHSSTLPEHTDTIYDGEYIIFCWMLERPIEREDFHKVYLLQRGLYELFKELNPTEESLQISSLFPQLGSINSHTGDYVGLPRHTGKKLNNELAEAKLMSRFNIVDHNNLQRHSRAILELLSLLHDRFFYQHTEAMIQDWLMFFGASLCHFCPKIQLEKELQAIAVSLRNKKKWSEIEHEYSSYITDIVNTAIEGTIVSNGIKSPPTYKDNWFNNVHGQLKITDEEISRLGFCVLAGDGNSYIAGRVNISHIQPVGEYDFMPVERLLLKKVA